MHNLFCGKEGKSVSKGVFWLPFASVCIQKIFYKAELDSNEGRVKIGETSDDVILLPESNSDLKQLLMKVKKEIGTEDENEEDNNHNYRRTRVGLPYPRYLYL